MGPRERIRFNARTERIEQIGEKADAKSVGLSIYYNTQGQPLSELLAFPIHPSMKPSAETDSPDVGEEKQRRLQQFDQRMAQIVNHYVLAAIGNQIDLNDQLEYILSELETHKREIIEDIHSGT